MIHIKKILKNKQQKTSLQFPERKMTDDGIFFSIFISQYFNIYYSLFFRSAHSLPLPLIKAWDPYLSSLFFRVLLPTLKSMVKSASVFQFLNSASQASIKFYFIYKGKHDVCPD